MNPRRTSSGTDWQRPLIGLIMVLVAVVALSVSYHAATGLPLQHTYKISVEVPAAAELQMGDPVQIGGARVGIVDQVLAEEHDGRPFARIELGLTAGGPLPVDSTASVRSLSILGEKTLELERGRSRRMVPAGGVLPLAQARPVVDLNDALSTFGPSTVRGLQGTISGLADGVAGRGDDLNTTISAFAPLLPALESVSDNLASPGTDLPGFIDGADRFLTALVPAAQTLPLLLADTAGTFDALVASQPQFGELLDGLPEAESQATLAFTESTPALRYLREITDDLRPAGPQLAPAVTDVDQALLAGPATLRLADPVARPLERLSDGIERSVPPKSEGLAESLDELDVTVRAVSQLDAVVGPAQEVCNVLGTALRNGGDVIGEGDATGSWFTFLPLITPFLLPTGSISSSTHVNDHPVEDSQGCVAGNEPFLPGPQLGNPAAKYLTTAHDVTTPPAVATARARAAGLLTPAPGARLR